MNGFDQIIREKLSALEGPYDESAWAFIEAELNKPAASHGFSSSMIGGIAAAAALGLLFTSLPDLGHDQPPVPTAVHRDAGLTETHQPETTTADVAAQPVVEHAPQEIHDIDFISHHLVVENSSAHNAKPAKSETKQGQSSPNENQSVSNTPMPSSAHNEEPTGKTDMNFDFNATGIQCPGSEIAFKALVNDKTAEVKWLFDGIHIVEGQNVRFSFETAGEHEAIMMYQGEGGKTMKLRKPFRVYDLPSPDISYSAEYNPGCFNQEVTLKAVPNSNTYQWEIDGKTIGSGANLKTLLSAGTHSAQLTAINAEGCISKETTVIAVDPGLQIFPPNTFTPNGDGLNDTWFPAGLENATNFSLQIVRFQDKSLVFETNEVKAWDGSINGTSERPRMGEKFIWNLLATDHCGQQISRSGVISIL